MMTISSSAHGAAKKSAAITGTEPLYAAAAGCGLAWWKWRRGVMMIKGYEETGRLLARRDTLNTLRNIESINSIDCSVILRMAESHTERQTITGGYLDLSTVTEALQAAVDKELEIVNKQLLDAGIRG